MKADFAARRVRGAFSEIISTVHRLGLTRIEATCGHEDFLGAGFADDSRERGDSACLVAEAEAGGRNREHGVFCAVAEVGGEGDRTAATNAESMNRSDDGFSDRGERVEGGRILDVIALRIFSQSLILELRDVGSGDECDLAFTAEYDDAYAVVRIQFTGDLGDRAPHVGGDGITTLGVIENDLRERTVVFDSDLSRHRASIAKPSGGSRAASLRMSRMAGLQHANAH